MSSLQQWISSYIPQQVAKPAKTAKVDRLVSKFSGISSRSIAEIESSDEFAERVSIITHDANIPEEWAKAYARVILMPMPCRFIQHEWQQIQDNIGGLLDDHAHDLVKYGWTIPDIFSCAMGSEGGASKTKGLLMLIQQHELLVVVDDKALGLRNRDTGNSVYYCKPLFPMPNARLIWECI